MLEIRFAETVATLEDERRPQAVFGLRKPGEQPAEHIVALDIRDVHAKLIRFCVDFLLINHRQPS